MGVATTVVNRSHATYKWLRALASKRLQGRQTSESNLIYVCMVPVYVRVCLCVCVCVSASSFQPRPYPVHQTVIVEST